MVKKISALILACFSACCQPKAQVTTTDSILVDGRYRSFRLYQPRTLTGQKHPLVINMHGLGSTASQQQLYGNFGPIADTAGFYVVMPQGTSYNGTPFWDVGFPGTPAVDDVRFIDTLMTLLINRIGIDPARIYATGMSNGGFMSYLLAVRLPQRIAAIASVTGGITPGVFGTMQSQRPIPVMEIHGTADATVPFGGSQVNAPVDSVIAFWVRNNGCRITPVRTAVPDINLLDGCTAERFRYESADGRADVELYRVNGGGHSWPGSAFVIGVTNMDFSASAVIWRFFSQYRAPGLGVRQGQGLEPLRIYPNPVRDRLNLRAPAEGTIRVMDFRGACVAESVSKTVDVSRLPAGVYLLQYSTGSGSQSLGFVKAD